MFNRKKWFTREQRDEVADIVVRVLEQESEGGTDAVVCETCKLVVASKYAQKVEKMRRLYNRDQNGNTVATDRVVPDMDPYMFFCPSDQVKFDRVVSEPLTGSLKFFKRIPPVPEKWLEITKPDPAATEAAPVLDKPKRKYTRRAGVAKKGSRRTS